MYKVENIRSIQALNHADGGRNLTPVFEGETMPILVYVSEAEYQKVRDNIELVKQLAIDKLNQNKLFYPPFSPRREDLRNDWNDSTVKDWNEFLELAEYRAIKVADALNKSIIHFTHKQILDTYIDLYKKDIV